VAADIAAAHQLLDDAGASAWVPYVVGTYGPAHLDLVMIPPRDEDLEAAHRWLADFLERASKACTGNAFGG
jgi:hypothetical protein